MLSTISPPRFHERPLARPDFLALLDASLAANEWRYARRLSTAWLAAFPGDLPVKYRYAQAIFRDEHLNSKHQAVDILENLCLVDPEYAEAQELLTLLKQREGLESHHVSKACAFALKEYPQHMASKGEMVPFWARQLQEARTAVSKHKNGDRDSLGKAEHAIHQALIENPQTPLAAVTHLSVMILKSDLPVPALLSLADIYHARWPECLHFSLVLADCLMDSGDPSRAVELLHQAVEKDIIGQVAQRIWGRDHPYKDLWPDVIEIASTSVNNPQSLPVPAPVTARLGRNQLPFHASVPQIPVPTFQAAIPVEAINSTHQYADSPIHPTAQVYQPGTKTFAVRHRHSPKNLSEPVRAVQAEFNRLAKQLKTPSLVNQDGRFPVYVIFTTRKGLEAQYGVSSAARIDDMLKKLARAIRGQRINHENWGAILIYADDSEYTSFFEMKPAPHNDPWALKLLLTDLDEALGKGGERVGAVLIVGGPEVVPFHHLPNPVDDADHDVLSDNPYTSMGENYFIQEWPVGRLPGGSSNDPAGILTALRSITNRYLESSRPRPWYIKIARRFRELLRTKTGKLQSSFGYTAAIWRRASLAVYRIIGNPQDLLVSPPVHACDRDTSGIPDNPDIGALEEPATCLLLPGTRLAYFNLHGIPDSSFWYGHRDPGEPLPGLEFPVAIRPQDVRNGGSAPQLVFSEACYSAHIIGKNIDDALSLKFLSSGSQAVIGSTCISYGSISTPLSAADLLGRIFWGLLEEGIPVGEALRRAKLHLVREMHRRQGFLDPEDQKTIISFVLYGDPLVQPFQVRRNAKSMYRGRDLPPNIQTVIENPQTVGQPAPVSPEIVAHVKSIVAQYLPGMADAQLHLTQTQSSITDLSPTAPASASPTKHPQPVTEMQNLAGRHVVSLSKNIRQANLTHAQYARLTMDSSGKLLKLTVSR